MWTRDEAIQVLESMAVIEKEGHILDFNTAIRIVRGTMYDPEVRISNTNQEIVKILEKNRTKLVAITRVDRDDLIKLLKENEETPDKKIVIELPWGIKIDEDNS